MSRLACLAIPLAVTALALGACGDDDETTTSPSAGGETTEAAAPDETTAAGPDPCTLLDDAAVEGAIGTAVEGVRDTQFGLDECAWEGEEGAVGETTPALYVTLGEPALFERYKQAGPSAQPVDGIGEEAVIFEGSARATGGGTAGLTVAARTADRTVLVAWSLGGAPVDTPPDQAGLESLAEDVLAGL